MDSGRVVGNIDIDTIYLDQNRNSKFRPLLDSARVMAVFSRYAAVGLAAFGVDYFLFLAASYLAGVHYLLAHTIARLCSGTLNFACNKRLFFRSRNQSAPEFWRYLLTALLSFCASGLLLYLLVDMAGMAKAVAKPVSELSVFLLNFIILNTAVFPRREE